VRNISVCSIYICDNASHESIWCVNCCRALADVDKDGRVDCREFSIAMYLIKRCLHGHDLPSTLPSSLHVDPVAVQTGSLLSDWSMSSVFGMPVSAVRPLPASHGYCHITLSVTVDTTTPQPFYGPLHCSHMRINSAAG